MAKVINNLITEGLSGSIADSDFAFRRVYKNTFLVKKSVPSQEIISESQQEVRSRFANAVSAAKAILTAHPENAALISKRLYKSKYCTVNGFLMACAFKNSYPEWIVRD